MYTIQANPSGTRSIEVSNENLRTIEKYALFRHLIDVIYHNNMKAFGLQQLIKLYLTWLSSPEAEEEEE